MMPQVQTPTLELPWLLSGEQGTGAVLLLAVIVGENGMVACHHVSLFGICIRVSKFQPCLREFSIRARL